MLDDVASFLHLLLRRGPTIRPRVEVTVPRLFRIKLSDYTPLKQYISHHPDRRTEFENIVLNLRRRGITTIIIDDSDGSEIYELVPLD